MFLRPLPDVGLRQLAGDVAVLSEQVSEAYHGWSAVADRLRAYQQWAQDALRRLEPLLPAEEIERLVATPRYWSLHDRTEHMPPLTIAPVHLELERATRDFDRLHRGLQADLDYYRAVLEGTGPLLLPDTNVYLHGVNSFDHVDWQAEVDVSAGTSIGLLLPTVVLDELDDLKQSSRSNVRGRARQSVKTLARVLSEDPRGGLVAGALSVQFCPEPRGHRRLPLADDEIVDVAAALAQYLRRPVIVVSGDVGMQLRAAARGVPYQEAPEVLP